MFSSIWNLESLDIIIIYLHGRPQGGGGQEGALAPPPLEIQKYGGPPKDNLTRKIKKYIY